VITNYWRRWLGRRITMRLRRFRQDEPEIVPVRYETDTQKYYRLHHQELNDFTESFRLSKVERLKRWNAPPKDEKFWEGF
jgi:hypothetical protein